MKPPRAPTAPPTRVHTPKPKRPPKYPPRDDAEAHHCIKDVFLETYERVRGQRYLWTGDDQVAWLAISRQFDDVTPVVEAVPRYLADDRAFYRKTAWGFTHFARDLQQHLTEPDPTDTERPLTPTQWAKFEQYKRAVGPWCTHNPECATHEDHWALVRRNLFGDGR